MILEALSAVGQASLSPDYRTTIEAEEFPFPVLPDAF
ncbi:MAG: hypothetical protein RLZZ511_3148 [Cyanobacteriota bacterium]|jgi:hypothetical protein